MNKGTQKMFSTLGMLAFLLVCTFVGDVTGVGNPVDGVLGMFNDAAELREQMDAHDAYVLEVSSEMDGFDAVQASNGH